MRRNNIALFKAKLVLTIAFTVIVNFLARTMFLDSSQNIGEPHIIKLVVSIILMDMAYNLMAMITHGEYATRGQDGNTAILMLTGILYGVHATMITAIDFRNSLIFNQNVVLMNILVVILGFFVNSSILERFGRMASKRKLTWLGRLSIRLNRVAFLIILLIMIVWIVVFYFDTKRI